MNFRFHYLYRDAHNYKRYGFVNFSNRDQLPLETVERVIKECLMEGEWFRHDHWQLPDLRFQSRTTETDHKLHEYSHVELTSENQFIQESVQDFLNRIRSVRDNNRA